MSRPVGPVGSSGTSGAAPGVPDARDGDRRVDDRRSGDRRGASRRKAKAGEEASESRDLVPVGDRIDHDEPVRGRAPPRPTADPAQSDSAFAAQLMGQEGQKRGLRGGAPVLDAARATYLGVEYTGMKDRRPKAGSTRKTDL